MASVPKPEPFPKAKFSKDFVQKERTKRESIPGAVCTITCVGDDRILTTVMPGFGDDAEDPPAASTATLTAMLTPATPPPTPPRTAAPDDATLRSAVRAAVRRNEIGNGTPYELSFAGKGNSGASFGFMQGDLAANQGVAHDTFRAVLAGAGFQPAEIDGFVNRLSVHLARNPLTPAETQRIDAALASATGQPLVDAMDESIFSGVCANLDSCNAAAAGAGRSITAAAQIAIALWINMSGPPNLLRTWVAGSPVTMEVLVPAPGPVVDANALDTYLRATRYFTENPGNFPRMRECVAAGTALLPTAMA